MPDDDLTPEESEVRRLLADARHTEPIPRDVADRLDRVLTDLRDEPVPSSVSELAAARRRRRVVRNLLVAAAAVAVVGIGSTVTGGTISSHLSESGDDAGAGSAADSDVAPKSAESSGPDGLRHDAARPAVVLDPQRFDRQVRRLLSGTGAYSELSSGDYGDDSASKAQLPGCTGDGWSAGARIPVEYDGRDGVLVVHLPSGGSQVVDLYLCGNTVPTRSVTVPAT